MLLGLYSFCRMKGESIFLLFYLLDAGHFPWLADPFDLKTSNGQLCLFQSVQSGTDLSCFSPTSFAFLLKLKGPLCLHGAHLDNAG